MTRTIAVIPVTLVVSEGEHMGEGQAVGEVGVL